MKETKIEIETSRLRIRELNPKDVGKVHELHKMPETDKYNTLGVPETIAETEQIVKNWLAGNSVVPRVRIDLCIEDMQGVFIGLSGIVLGKRGYNSGEIWYKVHPEQWNKGYATEAVKAILVYCFKDLRLHRVEAGCATGNTASIGVLEKAGFKREGMKRKKLPIRGKWEDNYFYGILDEDL